MKSVIVVGSGIWGSSLALRLAETGWRVTLVEQHQPGHVRQSSAAAAVRARRRGGVRAAGVAGQGRLAAAR
jgi:glycine/D-amino acid oxidase-like deaminating enzyme